MSDMLEELPSAISGKAREASNGETIIISLKGAMKEGLICTDRRAIIIKSGFMTGNTFGANVFQLPYRMITSVEVKYGMGAGHFEISSGGVQNATRSYWTNGGDGDAKRAPNCVSIVGAQSADRFRAACNTIMDRVANAGSAPPSAPPRASIADEIAKLAGLHRDGYLTSEEFEAQKQALLSSTSAGPSAPIVASPRSLDSDDDSLAARHDKIVADRLVGHRRAEETKVANAASLTFGRRRT